MGLPVWSGRPWGYRPGGRLGDRVAGRLDRHLVVVCLTGPGASTTGPVLPGPAVTGACHHPDTPAIAASARWNS